MEVFRSLAEARALRGCAVAIGNFDGVHLGHRRLFEAARARSAPGGARAVALTFEPHPARVLRPDLAPPLLTPLERKLELMAERGLDAAVVQPFDLDWAQTGARAFVERDLCGHLGAAHVVVGYDFTAGHERARAGALRAMLLDCGVSLEVIEPVTAEGLTVSSTRIREFLLEGRVDAAALLLGRPHDVEGVAERGAGRGRALGFPTANLRPAGMLPAHGVYAVRVRLGAPVGEGGVTGTRDATGWDGVCNVGVKPTVEEGAPVTAEAHLLDFDGRDLHGQRVRIAFIDRLRDERRFPSVVELTAQIARDVERAREVLRRGPM
jgi:riboflavin kinase/FMN adenylyltransferase